MQIPDGFDIFSAQFARAGDDLLIAAEGSPQLTVVDYFTLGIPPALVAPGGAMLTGDVVELLAGPRAPAQYAQAAAPEGAAAIGQVETLSGSATATRATGETVELALHDPVFQGDVLQTAGESTLGLRLEDGTLASMSADSRLVLNEFVFDAGGSDNWMLVNLVEGAFAFLTGAIAPSGGMEITTPVAVMAIRGTMPIAFVAGENGASQFFAGSDKDYELLHLTTRELLTVITSEAGFSLSSPNAPLETISIDAQRLDEINDLLDVLNDTAASLGLLGIQDGAGFYAASQFGNIDGNLGALIQFLQLLEASLAEKAIIEVADSEQFLLEQPAAELIANPDATATTEIDPVAVDVIGNDSDPEGGELTVIFAAVPDGQGSVSINGNQQLVYDPGEDFHFLSLGETRDVTITYAISNSSGAVTSSTVTVTVTGINQAPVIVPVAGTNLDEQTDTLPLETTIAVTFTDVDLNNVGHQAVVTAVTVNGVNDGLTLDEAGLIALLSPGPVTKNAGEGSGSVGLDFSAASTMFDYLAQGETVTLTYTVEIDDQDGGVTQQNFDVVITGTNDGPVISGADATGAVIEDASNPTLSDSGTITFDDADLANSHGATVTADAGNTLGGTLVASVTDVATGAGAGTVTWTYEVANAAVQYLAEGETATETFTVRIEDDDGGFIDQEITVTVTGTNDGPTISAADAAGAVTEDASNPTLSDSGTITFDDADLTNTHEVGVTADAGNTLGGTLVANLSDPATGAGAGTVTWTYEVANAAVQYLAQGETATETFTVRIEDNDGGFIDQEIIVTVTGTNDGPTISAADAIGAVTEDASNPTLTDSGTITFDDIDLGNTHDVGVTADAGNTLGGTLVANVTDPATGAGAGTVTWTYEVANAAVQYLAQGETATETFTVRIEDNDGGFIDQTITVTVTGTGDGPTISAADAAGAVTEDASNPTLSDSGTITFDDLDLGNTHEVGVTADAGNTLGGTLVANVTDAATGAGAGTVTWTYEVANAAVQYLAEGETATETFTVRIEDDDGGFIDQDIIVTVTGTNDSPTISAADATGAVTEDASNPTLSDSGTITFDDLDLANTHDVGVTADAGNTLGGTLVASVTDAATGAGAGTVTWTYEVANAAVQYLAQGETATETFTVRIEDNDGGFIDQEITVTVTGTNDGPTISLADAIGAVIEDASNPMLSDSGTITFDDLDLANSHGATVTADAGNTLGGTLAASVTDAATGAGAGTVTWTYEVANAAVQYLAVGETATETFTVRIEDDDGGFIDQTITVTVTGTNDSPTISAADAIGAVTEQAGVTGSETELVDGGTIVFADADLSDTHSATFVANASEYIGSFALGALNQGANSVGWTFTVEDAALDHLAAGEQFTQSYTVTIDDGNGGTVEQVVNVSITGTNDAPETDDVSGLTGFAGTAIEVTLSGSDVDGTVSAFKITTPPPGGGLFLDAQGLVPVDPNNIPASGNEATIYFIPDGRVTGDVSFQYAAVDNSGAQDATPASVDITVETTKIYITISQDTWEGGADLPKFQDFKVTIAGVTYDLGDMTVVDSNFYSQDGDGFALGIGFGSGGKERLVTFEIDGVPAGATAEISFDYMVADQQGEAFRDGVRFFAGDSPDDMVLVFDGDNHEAFTGNENNAKFSSRVLSFDYAIIAGVLAVSNQELSATVDPIILDLGEPGFDLSGSTTFDLDSDGQAESLAWTGGEDAILAMDLDGSGTIDSGNEVFSPYFGSGGFADALAALASLDGNGDGVIDGKDEAFADLLAWVDANSDGESQPDELTSLADLGIESFDLNAGSVAYEIDGQSIVAEGQFTRADGTTGNYVAVELDRILDSSEPLIAGNDGSDIDAPDQEVAAAGLSIDDLLVDYQDGSAPDMAEIGFAMATGQHGSIPADVDPGFELSAPADILIKLTEQNDAANVEIA